MLVSLYVGNLFSGYAREAVNAAAILLLAVGL
jgi:hypothetical protein